MPRQRKTRAAVADEAAGAAESATEAPVDLAPVDLATEQASKQAGADAGPSAHAEASHADATDTPDLEAEAAPGADDPQEVPLAEATTVDALATTPVVHEASEDAVAPDEAGPDVEAAPVEALPSLIEALLFVSDGPVELKSLARSLGVTAGAVEPAIEVLRGRLENRGVIVQTGPEGVQLVTAPIAAQYVEAFLGLEAHRRLSNAALETLAIVAYRQPVTRTTIDAIRGVSSDGAMQTLRARGLIEESGRSQGPGRATLFVTTQRFLEHFGLNGPQDLPDLGDIELPPPDTAIPMPGFDGRPAPAAAGIDEVADTLTSLSAAARALADPQQRRPGATALLLPGPRVLSLPSPAALPASGASLPPTSSAAPWE